MDLKDIVDPLLVIQIYLKASFVGQVLRENTPNHYGPLHVEWMDDPTNCREKVFSPYAPIAPIVDPVVITNSSAIDSQLYCEGDEYLSFPLPQTSPPSPVPSLFPTLSFYPSSTPISDISSAPRTDPTLPPTRPPTYSSVGVKQLEALRLFYKSTQMDNSYSSAKQNWFKIDDYCSFTGITCDVNGYVISIDLFNKGLAGTLPLTWDSLNRLTKFKVAGNEISGPIPSNLYELDKLTTIELSNNRLTGEIPRELRRIKGLRRLFLQYNNFNGTIHKDLCELKQLTVFLIAGNVEMSGEIPVCFGDLPLEVFRVDNVGLVGKVPSLLCGVRLMNGLNPNQFGCDGLACPAGTFGASFGRQLDNNTQCIACPVPSNVIGSSTCAFLEGNEVVSTPTVGSLAPSSVSVYVPSALLSVAPSVPLMDSDVPSFVPSPIASNFITSSPSYPVTPAPSITLVPTNSPTAIPSTAWPIVIMAVSTAPSTVPSDSGSFVETVELTLVFVGVTSELSDTESFADATKIFLTNDITSIYSVDVISQSVQAYSMEAAVSISNRQLKAKALFVNIKVEGSTDNGNLADAVKDGLLDLDTFVTSIGLTEEVNQILPITPTRQVESPPGKSFKWGLLGSAIGLSVVAVASVYTVRSNRRKSAQQRSHFSTSIAHPALNEDSIDHSDDLSEESNSGWSSSRDDDESMSEDWSTLEMYTATKSQTDSKIDEML